MIDTGDIKQVNKKKTKMQLRRMKENEWLKEILSKEGGRDFIWRLLIQCGVYDTSFTGDAPHTFFNEGKRQIGLWLLTEIDEADNRSILLIHEENK